MRDKTKRVAARLQPLDVEKIKRYFNYPTLRCFIESTIELSETDSDFRQKLEKLIRENQEVRKTVVK